MVEGRMIIKERKIEEKIKKKNELFLQV